MNRRDLSELKRRLNPDRRDPTLLRGCYISSDGQVLSTFAHSVGALPQEEYEKYTALFRRCLSGAPGQQLLPVEVGGGDAEREADAALLRQLCDTALEDEAAVEALYAKAVTYVRALGERRAQSVDAAQKADNYLFLLLHDGYDVPFLRSDGERDPERSESVFHYILCALCPVKQSRSALRYFAPEQLFHSTPSDWVVGAPELGFLYPAFEERGANIHRAAYYTRSAGDLHEDFLQAVFHAQAGMTPQAQQETFQELLEEKLEEECSLEVMQSVHETLCDMIAQRQADKTAEPLTLSAPEVERVLLDSGVSQEKAAAFEAGYRQAFGDGAELPAVNMVSTRTFRLSTPSVSIQVDPEHTGLLQTRMIDGRRYILILADGDVEVNGVRVQER